MRTAEHLAVSPDGTRIAFSARDTDDQILLWVRPLDSLDAFSIRGSSGASFPFWSPDGRSLGFFAQGKLKVVEASASALPVALADVEEPRGGAWGPDGTILFSNGYRDPIMRVPAPGGSEAAVTEVKDPEVHRWPVFLPDGRHFLYSVRIQGEEGGLVYAASLDSKDRKRGPRGITRTSLYVPPGRLLFRRGGRLMAVRFDAEPARSRRRAGRARRRDRPPRRRPAETTFGASPDSPRCTHRARTRGCRGSPGSIGRAAKSAASQVPACTSAPDCPRTAGSSRSR